VGQYLISQVMVQIGFMVMPIMVPWLVLEYSSFLFDGWLKFMISAGLTKVVGAIIFGMSTDLLTAIVNMANLAGSSQLANFGLYSAIMILSALLAYLMLQTTSIAHGLMHGIAAGKFVAPTKMSPGGASTSSSKGIQSGVSSVGRGIKDGASGMKQGGFKAGLGAGMRSAMGMKTPVKASTPPSAPAAAASAPAAKASSSISSKLKEAKLRSGR
jgi:type IV secretory pathway VirB6-like protein